MNLDDDTTQQCLQIIGEIISVDPDDFQDHETWKFLGVNGLLVPATIADLKNQANVHLPDDIFDQYPTVGSFKAHLQPSYATSTSSVTTTTATNPVSAPLPILSPPSIIRPTPPSTTDPWTDLPKPKMALSTVLQNSPGPGVQNVFLFPDGSGLGAAYSSLPPLSPSICLIALNSPFLRQASAYTISIPHVAALWLPELLRLQSDPSLPFILAGWSAGGFYAFETAKLLQAASRSIERLVLIDSPCRLRYTGLPESVVAELTRKGLMGASSSSRKAPEWLVEHFNASVRAVEEYWPTPMAAGPSKGVSMVWVREGLVEDVAKAGLDVDLNVAVTRFLLEARGPLEAEGWEDLFPMGTKVSVDYMSGNHFQITQAPHSHSLGDILRKLVATR